MIDTVQNLLYSHTFYLLQKFENQPLRFHKNTSIGSLISIPPNALRSFKIWTEFLDLCNSGTWCIYPFILLLVPSEKFHIFFPYRCCTVLIRLILQECYWFCSYFKWDFFFCLYWHLLLYRKAICFIVHYFYSRPSFIST